MTGAAAQLTTDGREVEHPLPSRQRSPRLTAAQRAILVELALKGELRSCEAGAIIHQCRPQAARAAARGFLAEYLAGQRRYAASDGLEALKRLAERGFVRRVSPGRWVKA
jgi:hypothetical protein